MFDSQNKFQNVSAVCNRLTFLTLTDCLVFVCICLHVLICVFVHVRWCLISVGAPPSVFPWHSHFLTFIFTYVLLLFWVTCGFIQVSIIQPVLFAHLSHSFQFVLLFLFVLFYCGQMFALALCCVRGGKCSHLL